MSKKPKQYLILLTGQGDRYTFIVGQAGWDYINSPYPDFKDESCLTEKIPPAVIAEMDPKMIKKYQAYGEGYVVGDCEVTTGSWDNDRAMHLSSFYKQYDKVPKADFADQYDGCIY